MKSSEEVNPVINEILTARSSGIGETVQAPESFTTQSLDKQVSTLNQMRPLMDVAFKIPPEGNERPDHEEAVRLVSSSLATKSTATLTERQESALYTESKKADLGEYGNHTPKSVAENFVAATVHAVTNKPKNTTLEQESALASLAATAHEITDPYDKGARAALTQQVKMAVAKRDLRDMELEKKDPAIPQKISMMDRLRAGFNKLVTKLPFVSEETKQKAQMAVNQFDIKVDTVKRRGEREMGLRNAIRTGNVPEEVVSDKVMHQFIERNAERSDHTALAQPSTPGAVAVAEKMTKSLGRDNPPSSSGVRSSPSTSWKKVTSKKDLSI